MAADDVAAALPSGIVRNIVEADAALRSLGVRYAVGGAVALGYHTHHPRSTNDLDLNLTVELDAVPDILGAIPGTSWSDEDLDRLANDGWMRIDQHGRPLDLFLPQHEFHAELQAEAAERPFGTIRIPIVSATHLTVLKAMFDRPKDWVDIESMLEGGPVDADRVLAWLAELLGDDSAPHRRFAELAASAPGPASEEPVGGPEAGR